MKKRIIISLLFGLIICCIAVYSFGTTGIVNVDTLRLRKSNSTDSSILTLLSVGDEVEIITRTDDGWYQVKYTDLVSQEEYEGYVGEEYLTVNEEETISEENSSEEIETSEEDENETSSEEEGTEEIVDENTTTKVINKGEKVYYIPLINTNAVSTLEEDITVEVLTEVNGWSYVTSDTFEGWIRTEKLQDVGAEEKVGYISATSVNFREQPNTSGTVIEQLSRNTEVVILEENNGWTKIEYKDEIGYVLAEYISSTKVATTSRSSSSRRTTTTTTATTATTTATSTAESTTETTTATSSVTGSEIVAYAKQYLGYKYVYGGNTPSGFDCSGFTQYVYKHFGYSLSRSSKSQAGDGVAVSKSDLQVGDIVCFARSSGSTTVGHVGIYIGGGQFIHAANSTKGVIISNVDGAGYYYVCARRII